MVKQTPTTMMVANAIITDAFSLRTPMNPSATKHQAKINEMAVERAIMLGLAFSPTGYFIASSFNIRYKNGQFINVSIAATMRPMNKVNLIIMNVRVRFGLRGPSHSGNLQSIFNT